MTGDVMRHALDALNAARTTIDEQGEATFEVAHSLGVANGAITTAIRASGGDATARRWLVELEDLYDMFNSTRMLMLLGRKPDLVIPAEPEPLDGCTYNIDTYDGQCDRCGDPDPPHRPPRHDPWLRDQWWCETCREQHDRRPAHWPPDVTRPPGRDGLD
jgi:hypothetical protein